MRVDSREQAAARRRADGVVAVGPPKLHPGCRQVRHVGRLRLRMPSHAGDVVVQVIDDDHHDVGSGRLPGRRCGLRARQRNGKAAARERSYETASGVLPHGHPLSPSLSVGYPRTVPAASATSQILSTWPGPHWLLRTAWPTIRAQRLFSEQIPRDANTCHHSPRREAGKERRQTRASGSKRRHLPPPVSK